MKILLICKFPPIQGGVSAECYWTANLLAELGHSVTVLTNADEVEPEYRMALTERDQKLLRGYRIAEGITVHSTKIDSRHVFIPQTNPAFSKLLNMGLKLTNCSKPDLIFGWYIEPYGVVAMVLSEITGIPYVIRHAGSDIGRLMLTDQLSTLFGLVFAKAQFVLTSERHHELFKKSGVLAERFLLPVSSRLPGDVFYPPQAKSLDKGVLIGMYGKVGKAKGTLSALQAISELRSYRIPVRFEAHWGGREMDYYLSRLDELASPHDHIDLKGFVPHWEIADFLRRCHIVLFLESKFSIPFHTPGVPFEVWSCGAHLITTAEIAQKHHLKGFLTVSNTTVIPDKVSRETVILAIDEAITKITRPNFEYPHFDAALGNLRLRERMQEMLSIIQIGIDQINAA
jgi:glycosyltransferase involved in cell wall biosynthesis